MIDHIPGLFTYLMCSSRKCPYPPPPPPPTEGTIALNPHLPGIPIPGSACHTPTPPEISVIFQLGWVPSGKNICVQNVVELHYYAKDNFFCDKMRKNLFVPVNTVFIISKPFFAPATERQLQNATERQLQLTTARANQTTALTNGCAGNWTPEIEFSPFRALSRRQMTFPFCC